MTLEAAKTILPHFFTIGNGEKVHNREDCTVVKLLLSKNTGIDIHDVPEEESENKCKTCECEL